MDYINQAYSENNLFVGYAFKLIKNIEEAKDMVQEAFIEAIRYNNKHGISEYGQLRGFIFKSIKWRYFNSFRTKKTIPLEGFHDHIPLEEMIEQINVDCIVPIIEKLNNKQKEVIYLSLLGKKPAAISLIMNLPIRQIDNLKYIACRKIRKELA